MFTALHIVTVTRARLVLTLAAVAIVLAAAYGVGVFGQLKSGGFDDPGSESARATEVLRTDLGLRGANAVLLVSAPAGERVDAPRTEAVGRAVVARLGTEPGVSVLADAWSAPPASAAALRARDGSSALIVTHLDGDEDAVRGRVLGLQAAYSGEVDGVSVATGGFAQATADITGQSRKDLARAEAIAIGLTMVLLVLTFGSVVAGALPLLVGVAAIVGAMATLRLLSGLTDVSVFSLNLVIALALGLGIDYALLIVNRFREELDAGHDVAAAVGRTLHTAGRTVLASSAAVALALSALLAFPAYFLRSFAYGGVAVVAVCALVALVVLPALLRVLGHRVARRRFAGPWAGIGVSAGMWGRVAAAVMRRPLWAAAPIVIGLLVMAVPLLDARFGLPDDRALPASVSQARRVADVVRERYQAREADAVTIALTGLDRDETATTGGAVARYAAELSRLPHVDRVDSAAGTFRGGAPIAPGRADLARGDAAAVLVLPTTEPYAEATQDLVRDVRAHSAPASVLVGGPTARYLDVNTAITTRLPLVGALIIVSTFVLLFLFTGSFVLPIKALAVNMLTIGAVSGAMVWVFQQGHGAGFLDVTPTPLSVSVPPLMFALSFGLSMDYEVFLLGRIAELHRAGVPTREAVVGGVARTGRIVTAAAALMSVTFLAFATAKVAFLQMLGLGCAVAVLLDATAVRGVLVPAMMRLMGAANWWAPGWARRLHARVGLAEGEAGTPYAPSSYAAAPAPRSHVAAP